MGHLHGILVVSEATLVSYLALLPYREATLVRHSRYCETCDNSCIQGPELKKTTHMRQGLGCSSNVGSGNGGHLTMAQMSVKVVGFVEVQAQHFCPVLEPARLPAYALRHMC